MANDSQSFTEEEETCIRYETYENEQLPESFLKKAKVELGETPEVREKCLELLKELLYAENKDAKFASDDEFLLPFLRSKKFNTEKSFRLVQNFVRMKQKFSYFQSINTIEPIRTIWKKNLIALLPYRDTAGRAVIIHRIATWDPSEISVEELYASVIVLVVYALQHPATQINGFVGLLDLKGLSLSHLRHFTPGYARLLTYGIQDCFPGRYKAVHVVNESTLFKYGYALVKIFLRPKFKRRLHVHGNDMKSLHKFLPPSILPSEFGGHLGPFDNGYLLNQTQDKIDRVWNILSYCRDQEG